MTKSSFFFYLCWIISIFLYTSCSFNYSQGNTLKKISNDIPNLSVSEVAFQKVQNNHFTGIIFAQNLDVFNHTNQAKFNKIRFYNINSKNHVTSEGQAEKASVATDTNNADIQGDIYLISYDQKAQIWAKTLFWTDQKKTLMSKAKDYITIKQKGGFQGTGQGFIANLNHQSFTLTGHIKGVYQDNES